MAESASKPKAKPKRKRVVSQRRPSKTKRDYFTQTQVKAALKAAQGIYSVAAEKLAKASGRSCTGNTIANYLKRYPKLREFQIELVERTLDIVEAKLMENILNGNMTAIIFYLKCKGKQRGWSDRNFESEFIPIGEVIIYAPDTGNLTEAEWTERYRPRQVEG